MIPDILHLAIVTIIIFMIMKVLKCMRVMEEVDIGIFFTIHSSSYSCRVYHSSDGGKGGSRSQ